MEWHYRVEEVFNLIFYLVLIFIFLLDDSTCILYDLRMKDAVRTFTSDKILTGINCIDLSMNGGYLFAGYDDGLRVWNTLTSKLEKEIKTDVRVSCLEVSPNKMSLCSGSWDNCVSVWDIY